MTKSMWPEDAPHSRACGATRHSHGVDCHQNCPSCHGMSEEGFMQYMKQSPETTQVFPSMVDTMQALKVAAEAMDSEQEGIRLAAAQTILRYSRFVQPNDESQAGP